MGPLTSVLAVLALAAAPALPDERDEGGPVPGAAKSFSSIGPQRADAGGREAVDEGGLTGEPMPDAGSGRLRTAPLTVPAVAVPPPELAYGLRTVRVEVEEGLPVDSKVFADRVMEILQDPRGWGHDGSVRFLRTDAEADITVVLASPELTDRLCAPLRTMGRVSCASEDKAVLNAVRWAEGAEPFLDAGGTLREYHEYLVNHEVGHLLGHPHTECPEPGEPAPVMVQQTLGLQGCTPNGWPAAD